MFGLDNKSGINVMPPIAPADSQTPLWFTEGGAGLSATYPGQDWFNQIQAELLNILKAADIAPHKGNLSQLSSAISKLASAYAVSIVHSTGQSLTSVMSQKAVTDLADKLQPRGNYASSEYFVIEGAGSSIISSGKKYSFSVMNNGTVGLYKYTPAGFSWLIENGELEQNAGSSRIKIMSQAAVSNQILGVGQNWRDMKPHRAASTLYHNTTGRTIAVSIQATSISGASPAIIVTDTDGNSVIVGGFNLSSSSGSAQLFAIVPPGHSYIAHVDIIVWSELS